jgi:hypothetical protein
MHLGDTEPFGDLGLRHLLEESQPKDDSVAFGQPCKKRADRFDVEHRVDIPEGFLKRQVGAVSPGNPVAGQRGVCAAGDDRFDDFFSVYAQVIGDLGGGRRTVELLRELQTGPVDLHVEIFESARNFHRPAMITKVSANFARDGRHGEGYEIRTSIDVEAVDCVEQSHAGDLDEILEGFAAIFEPARDVSGKWQTTSDYGVALAPKSGGLFVERFEMTEHLGDVGVVGSRLGTHEKRPSLVQGDQVRQVGPPQVCDSGVAGRRSTYYLNMSLTLRAAYLTLDLA